MIRATKVIYINISNLLASLAVIKELNLNDLRHNIGYVPQEDFLFSDDIANNIAFGSKDEDVSQADIESAAMKAQVHENIIDFHFV